jgi:hypothetical protein
VLQYAGNIQVPYSRDVQEMVYRLPRGQTAPQFYDIVVVLETKTERVRFLCPSLQKGGRTPGSFPVPLASQRRHNPKLFDFALDFERTTGSALPIEFNRKRRLQVLPAAPSTPPRISISTCVHGTLFCISISKEPSL